MNITLHGERDQNEVWQGNKHHVATVAQGMHQKSFWGIMDKLRRQTVKMPTSEMGANINMKQLFCTFRNSPHNQWNSTTMLKHQDSNISSFTKLKTPITWNFNFRFNKINKIQLTKTCLKELPGLYKTWSTTHLTSKTFSSETGYSTTTWFYESGIDWVENSRFILEWNLNASVLNQCLN